MYHIDTWTVSVIQVGTHDRALMQTFRCDDAGLVKSMRQSPRVGMTPNNGGLYTTILRYIESGVYKENIMVLSKIACYLLLDGCKHWFKPSPTQACLMQSGI